MKKSLAMMLALIMVCALPGIASAIGKGSINGACITQNAVSIELEDITFADSVKVELFSDKTLLTTATLNEKALEANTNYDYVTCCIPTVGEDDKAWSLTTWIPRDKIVPNTAVLFVDGEKLDTKKFTLDAKAWADLPGTVPYSGSINGACITQNAVSIELEDITFEKSVQVKLFSGETLLTTATLNVNEDILKANTYYQFVTCCIPTEGADDKAWSLTPWIPRDNIIPTKAVLFVDDHEMNTMTFKLDAEAWAALPGTASPSYNGGTTGGESHWHPPVTPAPVPVVVIPPKTGDMTIWQSILHFFGVI